MGDMVITVLVCDIMRLAASVGGVALALREEWREPGLPRFVGGAGVSRGEGRGGLGFGA